MKPIRTVLITGANAGLGLEAARQLALRDEIERVYLACRNETKASAAKARLEDETGRSIFEVVLMDTSDLDSVRQAANGLAAPVDAVILNAGGMGGTSPRDVTSTGASRMFAVNVAGHAALIDAMVANGHAPCVVVYAGSEAARGIPRMGVARPALDSRGVDEFLSIADGSKFANESDTMVDYANVKLMAALWMASLARQYPQTRFVTMSPGGTTGTNGMDDLPFVKRMLFKHVGGVLMPLFGMMHGVEDGAKRYVDAVTSSGFETGRFYASKGGSPTGPVADQARFFDILDDHEAQDNARRAVEHFLSSNTDTHNHQQGAA